MASTHIHQLGNSLLIFLWGISQGAKVKVADYRDGDVNARHALLESLELLGVLGHDAPDRGATLTLAP